MLVERHGSVRALAKALELPYGRVHHYVAGDREPTQSFIEAIYHRLGISPLWFLTGEGPMLREDRAHARGPDQAPTDPRRAELLDAVNAWWDGADEDERAWLKVHLRHTVPGFDKPPKT